MSRNRPSRTMTIHSLEALDARIVPTGLGISAATAAMNEVIVSNRGGQALGSIYQEYVNYEQAGGQGAFNPTEAGQIYFSGTSVGVDIHYSGSDFNFLVSELQGIGMQVTASLPQNGIVEGYLPISQLPIVAENPYETSLSPVYRPVAYTNPPPTDAQNEAAVANKGGQALGSIYTEYVNYEESGAVGPFSPTAASQVYFSGTSVGVDIRFNGGDYNTLVAELQGIGMQVTATLPQDGIVEGYLPISQLPIVAGNPYTTGISPVYRAVAY